MKLVLRYILIFKNNYSLILETFKESKVYYCYILFIPKYDNNQIIIIQLNRLLGDFHLPAFLY